MEWREVDATSNIMTEGTTATTGATHTGGHAIEFASSCSPGHGVTQSPYAFIPSAMPDISTVILPAWAADRLMAAIATIASSMARRFLYDRVITEL